MIKFYRTLKRYLKKIKIFISDEELLKLKCWILNISDQNQKILKIRKKIQEDKLKTGISHLKDLEKEPAKRGEVFHVDFGYGIGAEYRYNHFCVILAVEGKIAIVAPLTSSYTSYNQNSNFVISLGQISKMPGRPKPSYALINQIRSISRSRLKRPSTYKKFYPKLTKPQLDLLDNCIKSNLTKLP